MKQRAVWLLAISFVASVTAWSQVEEPTPAAIGSAQVAVYFSPKGGAQEAVVREINAAKRSIRVQAYSFTSAPIASALVDAHKRGVKVEALLDDSNQTARYSSATFLTNAGVPVLIDGAHAIAHSKIILVDSETIITGSFNFSKAAEERNAENLLVLKQCPDLVAGYGRNFDEHAAHATKYERKNPRQEVPEELAPLKLAP